MTFREMDSVIRTLRIDENLRMLYFEDAVPRGMAFNGNASVKAHMTGALSEDLHGNIIFADVTELFWGSNLRQESGDRRSRRETAAGSIYQSRLKDRATSWSHDNRIN
jgi:hypothetical protein